MFKVIISVLLCGLFLTNCGCSNKSLLNNPSKGLIGNYYSYHAALGSGKGIVLNIPFPDALKKKYTIDSFYIQGKSIAFTSSAKDGKLSIEANLFVNNPPESISIDSNQNSINKPDLVLENIIINHQFQPAYLLVHHNNRKHKIVIESFNELKPESIY
jgi:hypothetical protein